MQIHLHEVKILQIHSARPEFVKNITAINQEYYMSKSVSHAVSTENPISVEG
jgi:hypothetical protein